jgi:hypothetical protein
VTADADGRYRCQSVPGLEVEVLAPADRTLGRKLRIYYLGREILGLRDTRRRAEEADLRAEEADLRAEEADLRAEEADLRAEEFQRQAEESSREAEERRQAQQIAEQRAERYLELLKQAGIEP